MLLRIAELIYPVSENTDNRTDLQMGQPVTKLYKLSSWPVAELHNLKPEPVAKLYIVSMTL